MTPKDIEALFTRSDGSYLCARWGRPIVPVIFGVEEESLPVLKGAIEAVVAHAGHKMAEQDMELGVNMMLFFFRDWSELPEVPDLDRMIPDLVPMVQRLEAEGASQYRLFRFDEAGAIRAVFVFLRMNDEMAGIPAETLALSQAVQSMLLWSDRAFTETSPLGLAGEEVIVRPEIAAVIRAAYDPVMPPVAQDASHALRLFARMEAKE